MESFRDCRRIAAIVAMVARMKGQSFVTGGGSRNIAKDLQAWLRHGVVLDEATLVYCRSQSDAS
jgi:hypothetical protein